ncbi:MAG: hypothetical protein WCB68_13465 [Pyrinomonadaceae bacterium]
MDRSFGAEIISLPASSSNPGDTYKRFNFITTFPEGGLQETDIFKRAIEAEKRVLGRVLVKNSFGSTENSLND